MSSGSELVRCACGQPLHYSDERIRGLVEKLIEKQGRYLRVTTHEGSWLVDRHYIALHGLKAWELPGLGFEKVS